MARPGEPKIEQFVFGGVDSRSNPANFPSGRAIRLKNFRPLYSGQLRLRYGYTTPTQAPVSVSDGVIHTAAYYEQFQGDQFVIFGQANKLKQLDINTGVETTLRTFNPAAGKWGHFRAGNKIFIGGTDVPGLGFIPLTSWDGTTLRPGGLATIGDVAAAAVTVATSATPGTWATTILTGYQLYAVKYNPITGHVGNRLPIGNRFTVGAPNLSVDVGVLPVYSPEVQVGIGRTNDGGEVPYWLVDSFGNRIVAPLGGAAINIADSTIDTTQELPTRNGGAPQGVCKFARVGQRIFGAKENDKFLYYTEDDSDAANGNFVGNPYESWAGNNAEAFPTGEAVTAIHAYRSEGWFFSKTHLAIWSQLLLQQGTNPWRGPWPSGCAGQRAWIETPYGPFWITPDKELMAFNLGGPVNVSDEYQASLLGKIGDQYVSEIEVAYLRDPEKHIDCLYILGKDKNGVAFVVVHDFLLKDARAPVGQGYEALYSGMVPSTLAGTGYTPRQNVRDTNGRERLWCGSADKGLLFQLEDGASDNNGADNTYSGDWIGLVYVGPNQIMVNAAEWQGDEKIQFSYLVIPTLGIDDMVDGSDSRESIDPDNNRTQVRISKEAQWIFVRVQLDSHPTDGDFEITDPPFMPFPKYGIINYTTAILGTERPLGR